tara:strand:- start:810 stop:1520 length:711 start_codon:yes stop_codon:yes gene_type:complete
MDNFDLKKYISEGKIHLQEAVVDRTQFKFIEGDYDYEEEVKEAGPNADIFNLENGAIVDPNFSTYHEGTQDVMGLADEQGHEWADVEDYFDAVEGHNYHFKDYPNDLNKIPDEVMRETAMVYGEDYGQFYGGDRDDYYQEENKNVKGKLLKEELMPKNISNKPFTIVYQVDDMTDYEAYDELLSDREQDLILNNADVFIFDSNTPANEIEDYILADDVENGNDKLERYGLSKYWKY